MTAFNPVTLLFIAIMAAIYVLSPKNFRRSNVLPTILTTIGILGTFVGITIGLLDFNVDNVQASIPKLLDGLKVAFVTSIFGITAAILIRLKNIYRQRHDASSTSEVDVGARLVLAVENMQSEQAAGRDSITKELSALREAFVGNGETTIVTQLQKLRATVTDKSDERLAAILKLDSSFRQSSDSISAHMLSLRESLAGDGDATIATQLQKLRITISDKSDLHLSISKSTEQQMIELRESVARFETTTSDNYRQLHKQLGEFVKELAENNTRVFIEALEQAIRDFNSQLTSQFGENFKHLNGAVGKLVTWQEQYRKQLEDLFGRFDESSKSLHAASSDLRTIAQDLGATVELMDELDTFVQATKAHVAQLHASLEAHAALADDAKKAFPVIEAGIRDLTVGFREHIDTMKDANKRQSAELRSAAQEQATLLTESVRAFSEQASSSFRALDTRVDEHMRRSSEVIAAQLKKLDEDLEKELVKAISSLGSQLTSLSSKFVEDYTPLTNKLRELVRLAEGDDDVTRGA